MRPKAPLHEVMIMRFLEVNEKFRKNKLSCGEAAEILGVSISTFYRMRQRYEENGEEGLADRRIGKLSEKKVPVDEEMRIVNLFKTKYYDFTVKHFHEKLVSEGFGLSYTWVKNTLQKAGAVRKAEKRGQHRRKRPRRPMPGMMLHQDGSTHQWVNGKYWDLIVTMDDATNEVYSMFFCEQEGTMSSFTGFLETFNAHGLPSSIYVDRGSHYFFTPEAGGKVDKTRLTQVGRAMSQLGIEMIPAYSPEARGRSERMFGTLQKRLPQELRIHGITEMDEANRFLRETFLREHNKRFAQPAQMAESAFTPYAGCNLTEVLCVHEERRVSNDNTVKYKGKTIQLEPDKTHLHYVKCKVRVHEYPDGGLAVFAGPRKLISRVLEERQNKEVDDLDEFIAFDPIPVDNKDGEAITSPISGFGRSSDAQVALQRCPVLRTANITSAE